MAETNGQEFAGILERVSSTQAFIRTPSISFARRASDPMITPPMMREFRLRPGVFIEGTSCRGKRGRTRVEQIETVNGLRPEAWAEVTQFDEGTVIAPEDQIVLETDADNISMRAVDIICPLGQGQRALIVAPARAGKTMLLMQMAQSVAKNYPDMRVVMLLVDERPEEITDMRRSITGEVFASSNDHDSASHLRIARLATDYVKRRVEAGEDVVLFLDSLTRLGRAFNREQRTSGRTMSGGVDIKALEIPRQIFGAARKIENGGSLTTVASILVNTGSRMDDLIFEEFKGTGNMEIVLERELADERIFPALSINKSGTRREERLWKESTNALQMLRRYLTKMPPRQSLEKLIEIIHRTPGNAQLIKGIAEGAI